VKYAALKENNSGLPLSKCCRLLSVSRSGYYEWLKRIETTSNIDEFGLKVVEIFHKFKRRYGAIRIRNELKKEGIRASRKKIRRAMKKYNLVAKATKKFVITTDSNHNLPISPDLLMRDFNAESPNTAWVADLTYIHTEVGWRYLAVVIDLFDRNVVGWALADHMKKELVINALKMAIKRRKPSKGLIAHSDRGSQYCSYAYQGLLAKNGFKSSMCAKGDPWDNAVAESFFGTFKVELIHGEKWDDEWKLQSEIREYIEIEYNRERQHSGLGYLSPHEFIQKWYQRQETVA
jgi:transposase InsO family protein